MCSASEHLKYFFLLWLNNTYMGFLRFCLFNLLWFRCKVEIQANIAKQVNIGLSLMQVKCIPIKYQLKCLPKLDLNFAHIKISSL